MTAGRQRRYTFQTAMRFGRYLTGADARSTCASFRRLDVFVLVSNQKRIHSLTSGESNKRIYYIFWFVIKKHNYRSSINKLGNFSKKLFF